MTSRNLALTPAHTREINDTALAKAHRKHSRRASWAVWLRRADYTALCVFVAVLALTVALIGGAADAPPLPLEQETAR